MEKAICTVVTGREPARGVRGPSGNAEQAALLREPGVTALALTAKCQP